MRAIRRVGRGPELMPGCYVSPHAKVPFHHRRQPGRGSRAPLHNTGIAVAVEWVSQRGNGERSSSRERAAERGGDFNETRPSDRLHPTAPSAQPGAALSVRPRGAGERSGLMQLESRRRASSER